MSIFQVPIANQQINSTFGGCSMKLNSANSHSSFDVNKDGDSDIGLSCTQQMDLIQHGETVKEKGSNDLNGPFKKVKSVILKNYLFSRLNDKNEKQVDSKTITECSSAYVPPLRRLNATYYGDEASVELSEMCPSIALANCQSYNKSLTTINPGDGCHNSTTIDGFENKEANNVTNEYADVGTLMPRKRRNWVLGKIKSVLQTIKNDLISLHSNIKRNPPSNESEKSIEEYVEQLIIPSSSKVIQEKEIVSAQSSPASVKLPAPPTSEQLNEENLDFGEFVGLGDAVLELPTFPSDEKVSIRQLPEAKHHQSKVLSR